jgi:hypothetical protein
MKKSPAEVAAEIDGWLFGIQRSMLQHRMDWQFDMMLVGVYNTPNHFMMQK